MKTLQKDGHTQVVTIKTDTVALDGNLMIPEGATGIVLFAHGSGSSRHSPRNRYVAEELNTAGLATLLFDLLTSEEEVIDQRTRHLRFDIGLLADRLVKTTGWLQELPETRSLNVGYFGASTGSAAALVAAAERPDPIKAIVSRGGRPDLAGSILTRLQVPTLLIVGGRDAPVLDLNRKAYQYLSGDKRLDVVPGATHLFEEPGALEQVATLATEWFQTYL